NETRRATAAPNISNNGPAACASLHPRAGRATRSALPFTLRAGLLVEACEDAPARRAWNARAPRTGARDPACRAVGRRRRHARGAHAPCGDRTLRAGARAYARMARALGARVRREGGRAHLRLA